MNYATEMSLQGRTDCSAVGYMITVSSSFSVKAAQDLFFKVTLFLVQPSPGAWAKQGYKTLAFWPTKDNFDMQYSLQSSPLGWPRYFCIFIAIHFQPLPNPISCSSPFTGVRPALWSEVLPDCFWSLSPLTSTGISHTVTPCASVSFMTSDSQRTKNDSFSLTTPCKIAMHSSLTLYPHYSDYFSPLSHHLSYIS